MGFNGGVGVVSWALVVMPLGVDGGSQGWKLANINNAGLQRPIQHVSLNFRTEWLL